MYTHTHIYGHSTSNKCTESVFTRSKVENSIASQSLVGRTTWMQFGVSLVIISFSFTEQTTVQWELCPLWLIPDNASSTGCMLLHKLWFNCPGLDFHYSILAFAWPTTMQLRLLLKISLITMECVFTWVHACVGHWTIKEDTLCGNMKIWHSTILWNPICAGDMVMDGSCTFSSNFFHQVLYDILGCLVIFHMSIWVS